MTAEMRFDLAYRLFVGSITKKIVSSQDIEKWPGLVIYPCRCSRGKQPEKREMQLFLEVKIRVHSCRTRQLLKTSDSR